MMNTSAAARVKVNGSSSVPTFENATPQHNVIREDWMKKIIDGAEQKRQFSISTIGLIVAITIALWQIGGSIISAVRGDTKQEMQIQRMQEILLRVEDKQLQFEEKQTELKEQFNQVLTEKKVQDAKIQGYQLGQGDKKQGHK